MSVMSGELDDPGVQVAQCLQLRVNLSWHRLPVFFVVQCRKVDRGNVGVLMVAMTH